MDYDSNNVECFKCKCGRQFCTTSWIATQKTVRGKVQKRRQSGCPKCHSSVSKVVKDER